MSKTIEIIVSPAGQASVQTQGFFGPSCRDASRFIEQALGRAVAERVTTEFHRHASQSSAEQQQQRG